jgi:hypothetical protein
MGERYQGSEKSSVLSSYSVSLRLLLSPGMLAMKICLKCLDILTERLRLLSFYWLVACILCVLYLRWLIDLEQARAVLLTWSCGQY